MKWLFFGLGLMAGGMLSVAFMCLCAVSGRAAEMEERMNTDDPAREEKET